MAKRIWAGLLGIAWMAGASGGAHAQSMESRQLVQATNNDRAQNGLGALKWSPALARAAQAHADRMVREGALSHQYPGELDLVERAGRDGAHFRVVAENLAVGPSPAAVETEWMHSPPHRRNILDARLDQIGVAVVRQGGNLWAVEDFAAGVEEMGPSQIERKVEQLLSQQGIRPLGSSQAARQTCAMDTGSAGAARPKFIMRWQGSDLDRLPDVLEEQIRTGRFHTAAVGACGSGSEGQGFTTYRLAVMLF